MVSFTYLNKDGLLNLRPLPREGKLLSELSHSQRDKEFVGIAQAIMETTKELLFSSVNQADAPTAPSQRTIDMNTPVQFTYHPPPRRRLLPLSIGQILLLLAYVVLIAGAIGESIFYANTQQYQAHIQATATAQVQQINTTGTALVQQARATATVAAAATATPVSTPPTGFVVTSLTNGQQIPNGTILTIRGNDASAGSGQVWVLLNDNAGNYYLQNKPVDFLPGNQWIAENIHPAKGITSILFMSVTSTGNIVFQNMVQMGSFQAFTQFPNGSQILLTIPITVV